MRGIDHAVTLLDEFSADERLKFSSYDGSIRHPQDQSLSHLFIDMEELELLAEDAMIALARLLESLEVLLELFLVGKGGAVQSGQPIGVRIAMPVA